MDLVSQRTLSHYSPPFAWRWLATALSFALFGIGGLLLRLLAFPLLALLPGDALSQRRRARRLVSWTFQAFIQFMFRTGVLTYEIVGAERLGSPGQMVIANHPSLLDVVFLIAAMRDANCIVKQSLWNNPYMRGPIRAAQYISNDGSMEMFDVASEALRNGQSLIIFPEGTRTLPGQLPKLHRGAAAIALRGARLITPVAINVSPTTLTKAEPWYRIASRRVHFRLQVGENIDPQYFRDLGPAPLASRQLNQYLHQYFMKELAQDEQSATGN